MQFLDSKQCKNRRFASVALRKPTSGTEMVEAKFGAHRGLKTLDETCFICLVSEIFGQMTSYKYSILRSTCRHEGEMLLVRFLSKESDGLQDPRANPETPPAFPPFLHAARKRRTARALQLGCQDGEGCSETQ